MNQAKLRDTLRQLRADVHDTSFSDPQARERVTHLIAAIEQQLAQAGDREREADLLGQLPLLIEQFEVEHPRLTATLNQVLSALSSMGI